MKITSLLISLLSIASLLPCPAFAERAEGDTQTGTFSPDFTTLKVSKESDFMSLPIIELGSTDRIVISFDQLGDEYSDLKYRLIHCNSDWQPSRLMESEYLDNFNEAEVSDYSFSSNTFVHYVNYRVVIPSEDMKPLRSGNYLVEFFSRYEPSEVLLQARFQVTDRTAFVEGLASGRTDRGINTEWQQLAFSISYNPEEVHNPYSDLIVTVTQNGRPETERTLSRPMRTEGNKLIYESLPELIFPAGNEYRRMETVRADYPGLGIDSVEFHNNLYHAYVNARTRAGHEYVFDRTQRGRFIIDEYNSTDPDLGADYINVNFKFDAPQIMNGGVYIDGEFTHHRFNDRNRMKYNSETGLYELSMPLKQGSYNYQFVAKLRGDKTNADPAPLEGNIAETCNEYNISVYLRTPASRGDKLIGTGTILTENATN